MADNFRIALTADLHYGIRDTGDWATHELVALLAEHQPDLIILAGDIGTGEHFERCLALFDKFSCKKALVPGNHDVWVKSIDPRGDSAHLYSELLPRVSADHGFHYLDQAPLVLPDAELAVVGSMNWYDYSWSIDRLKTATPQWEDYLARKCFTRGKHNDGNFVRWPFTDDQFTAKVVEALASQLDRVTAEVHQSIVVTHHPPFRGLNYPRPEPLGVDDLLWQAFSGNTRIEKVLKQYADRIAFAFCGHTHFAVGCEWHGIRGYNIGGDYHFKRLLMLDWPTGTISALEFRPDHS
jgi:predicted phosphohydrolase